MRIQPGKRCPYANILILWRLYWEDLEELFHLLGPYRKRVIHGTELPINWRPMPGYLPRELLQRVFAIECLAVLEECHLLIRRVRRLNQHTFYPGFLRNPGRSTPYWLIERSGDSLWRLHIWKARRPRKAWSEVTFREGSKPAASRQCDGSGALPAFASMPPLRNDPLS
jgi:hypothetical protein